MFMCDKCDQAFYDEGQFNEHNCDKEPHVSVNGSLRLNKGKLPMHLIPPEAEEAMAAVLGYGAQKYAIRNWEKGSEYSIPYASLRRHLNAFWKGEDNDPESKLPHTYHILMNAAMLVYYEEHYKELDDRPIKNVDKV